MSKIDLLSTTGELTKTVALGAIRRNALLLKDWLEPLKNQKLYRRIEIIISKEDLKDEEKDAAFIARLAIKTWEEYVSYWAMLRKGLYQDSWINLQNCLDCGRAFISLNGNDFAHIQWLISRCEALEKLYPHRLFVSMELICDVVCSVCGRDPMSIDCKHRPGVLYGGKLMSLRAVNLQEIPGIALTESPKDKRCVVQGLDHSGVAMFHGLYRDNGWSPILFNGLAWREKDGRPHVDVIIEPRLKLAIPDA